VVQHRKFMGLALDDEGLHTPDGDFKLSEMTKAEVRRHRRRDSGEYGSGSSTGGAVGGALLGGALAGPIGLVGGALLGSKAYGGRDTSTGVPRTVSASVTFESPDLAYTTTVGRDQIEDAEAFVAAVKGAAGLR
jgi:hypothetical protein